MRVGNRFNSRTVAICLGLALILGSGAAKAEKIVIGTVNWAYMQVMSNVLKVLIEENYGEEVEFVPAKHAMFFKAMDNGKGEVDIFPDLWLPNNQGMFDEYVTDRGTVAITQAGSRQARSGTIPASGSGTSPCRTTFPRSYYF